jgi:hypothetical protein
MIMKQQEKELLDLIAKYTFLTNCKDNGLLDLGTYSKALYQLDEEDMERIKYYMQRPEEHHNDTSKFMDGIKEEWNVT